MELSISLIEAGIIAAGTGLVGWVWFLHGELVKLQIELAKNYHSKEELRQSISDALSPLTREIERLARAVERIEQSDRQQS